eukprot:10378055-Lingulodinium_polyedra.AAC.1
MNNNTIAIRNDNTHNTARITTIRSRSRVNMFTNKFRVSFRRGNRPKRPPPILALILPHHRRVKTIFSETIGRNPRNLIRERN